MANRCVMLFALRTSQTRMYPNRKCAKGTGQNRINRVVFIIIYVTTRARPRASSVCERALTFRRTDLDMRI